MSNIASTLRGWALRREAALAVILIALVVSFAVLSPHFLTPQNMFSASRFYVETGLIALGMTLVIVTGGIDLSVGSTLALVSVLIGFTYAAGVPMVLAIVIGLLAGALAGFFNGFITTSFEIHPLAVTLGTLALYGGLALAISGGGAVSKFPEWFGIFGQTFIGPIPAQLFVFAILAVAVGLLLGKTTFGRRVYALGTSARAAAFSGTPTKRIVILVYTLTGLLAAVASIIYTSRVSTARADAGVGMELAVIAAVVLGGASIRGGRGTVLGTVLGVLIIGILRNGLTLSGVPGTWSSLVLGVVLLSAVYINERSGSPTRARRLRVGPGARRAPQSA